MDTMTHILNGFAVCLQPINLWYTFLGCFLGTIIGVLPGIGPSATIALLIPVTYGMNPTSALIMMCGIFYGARYGGSTTAILINTPGEASSVMTTLDGYQMAKKGRGGAALADLGGRLVHRRHARRGRPDAVRHSAHERWRSSSDRRNISRSCSSR